MAQSPASAVENIPAATLRKIEELVAGLTSGAPLLLSTSGEQRLQVLQDIVDVSMRAYLTTTIALEKYGPGVLLPSVPRQRISEGLPR